MQQILDDLDRRDWERRLLEAVHDGLDLEGQEAVLAVLAKVPELHAPRKRGPKGKDASIEKGARAWIHEPDAKQDSLANEAGVAPSTFSEWVNHDPRFMRKAGEIAAYAMDRADAEDEDAARDLDKRVEQLARDRLPQWIADRWTGPVRVPDDKSFDGAVLVDAAAYIDFLKGRLPVELLDEVRAELNAKRKFG